MNDKWKGGSTDIRPEYYYKYKIDPWTFIMENELPFDVGAVIKYVIRHKDKNKKQDLKKAIKVLEMMIEYHYPGESVMAKEIKSFFHNNPGYEYEERRKDMYLPLMGEKRSKQHDYGVNKNVSDSSD